VLAVYSNVAIAWIGALVADLVVNKPLGLSPRHIEFRRAYLYDFNPVGLGAMLPAATVACAAHAGLLGSYAAAFSPFLALVLSFLLAPLLAWITRGRYYLARPVDTPASQDDTLRCSVCTNQFELPDMASCPAYGAPICSLCCSLESRCHDRCKTQSRASEQIRAVVTALLPGRWAVRFNFRLAQYTLVLLTLCGSMAFFLAVIYLQESLSADVGALLIPFLKVFTLLSLLAAVCAWWVVLATDSRRLAHEESERQTALLRQEIDAHRRTDAALQAAKEQAESASHAKTRYVAGMTHELRTPLNTILGFAQILLKDGRVEGPLRESLAIMQHSGQHMHALIDGSLELARIEAGRLRLDPAPLPLTALLEEITRMVRPQAQAKGLDFSLLIEGQAPAWIRADGKRLRQILLNLLGNAVRFTDRGEVRLKLDFRQHVARIEVSDTGIGIAPQDIERIFLPFERGSAGRRSSEAGTGLGLTITHLLTELMGGQLSVHSALGQGSTFIVRLYIPGLAETGLHLPVAQAAALRPVVGYRPPRRSLLVVDDQPLHRQLLAGLLTPLGFEVREAASGSECLEVVAAQRPDLILLDLSLDEMDGWETAARLRGRHGARELPIVFVSANLFDNLPEKVNALDCQGFVGKPVIESELHGSLQRALGLTWTYATEADPADAVGPHAASTYTPAPPLRAMDTASQALLVTHLPSALREDLLRFARQGNAAQLKQHLRDASHALPQHGQALSILRACCDRFDFQALAALLRNPDHESID